MTTVNFDSYLPEGERLLDYQHVGVAYALVAAAEPGKGALICDEQGLGKTRQAIVTAKVRKCRKVLVVCKASLRGNWAHEYARCAPELSVEVLAGPVPYEVRADVAIIAFDSLSKWIDGLVQEGFDALIIDESHYVKSLGTTKNPVQRTVAALQLSEHIRKHNGLVLLLTGTPVLNRPIELITQLQCVGRLRDIAPRPRKRVDDERSWEFAFKFAYCGPQHNGHGYEFKGATNLDELNTKLRSSCYVRRLRNEVLGMNETSRFDVNLSLNGALDEYRRAEANFLAYLRETGGQEALSAALRAEMLVYLNTMRKLAGEAKIEAAAEWIADFLEENPGKKLVVFAWHIEVQKALAKSVKGAIYLGGVKDIEAAKREFNEGDARVIVCSLQAHREGHTLVGDGHNVTDVLFVENPWHAGAKSQAEDRINRIGQQAEHVFAWTLLGNCDIDEWMNNLVESKRVIARGAADGTVTSIEDEESLQDALIRKFTEKASA